MVQNSVNVLFCWCTYVCANYDTSPYDTSIEDGAKWSRIYKTNWRLCSAKTREVFNAYGIYSITWIFPTNVLICHSVLSICLVLFLLHVNMNLIWQLFWKWLSSWSLFFCKCVLSVCHLDSGQPQNVKCMRGETTFQYICLSRLFYCYPHQ